MAVTECPEKGVQSPTPIGGLDFLDMDRLIKYPEIKVLDFLDTPHLCSCFDEVSEQFSQCPSGAHLG
ncbi:hypothetical protein MCEZE10_00363 [Sphingomonadaceae bacterium]